MSNGPEILTDLASGQPNPELVRAELGRLMASDQFKNSKRCRALLGYLVEETLAGRGDQLKERLVGAGVFGRELDYDTAEDPVVRNAAIEVRKRLAQYYVDSGSEALIRIELHAGTYIPEFRCPQPATASAAESVPNLNVASAKTSLGGTRLRRFGALAALLVVSAAGYWGWRHPGSAVPSGNDATQALTAATNASAEGDAVRILAGSTKPGSYVDRFGNQWLPDRYFSGGDARLGITSFFFPPADPELYRSMRIGAFSYDIPLKAHQSYQMRLYFVEPVLRYGNEITGDGAGSRTFQVNANNKTILDYFDPIADAGFASTTVRTFKDIAADSDGKLHLRFVRQQSDPVLSAIELLPSAPHIMLPIRIHAAQFYYQDQRGNRWSPDNFFIGGSQFDARVPAAGSNDPDMFKVERVGNFHYAIPVPPGRYSLTLYFAETWFHEPGQRVFDVTCNGEYLFHKLDIVQQVGFSHVYQKTFHGLEPNGQGKLLIGFSPIVNYASVRALEVTDESR